MGVLAAGLNVAMATVYFGIGGLIAVDLESQMRRRGYSHFGVAWLTIMFTCGAHHLVHGVHLGAEGRAIGWLDVLAVAAGLPVAVVWSLLRIEARQGGRGDRFVAGTPAWLSVAAGGCVVVTVAALGAAAGLVARGFDPDPRLLPNVLLVLLYLAIGAALLRGQRRNRRVYGGWSLSGLSLMMIFPTCALMHTVYVLYVGAGVFVPDFHGLWVDWAGVPAALYFLWVVAGLETGTVTDWNERFEAIDDLSPVPVVGGVR